MKLRDFRKHTFRLSMAWCQNPTPANRQRLITNLKRWAKHVPQYYGELADYGYKLDASDPHNSMWCHVSYCSDRMNQGRAKALLRLFREIP